MPDLKETTVLGMAETIGQLIGYVGTLAGMPVPSIILVARRLTMRAPEGCNAATSSSRTVRTYRGIGKWNPTRRKELTMSLILSRKLGEKIIIGPDVVVTVTGIDRGRCRLAIEAPRGTPIMRSELLEKQYMPGDDFDPDTVKQL